MLITRRTVLATALTVPATAAFARSEVVAGDLTIVHAWSRATPGGARVAGGYMTIRNRGSEPDALIGGTLDAAGRVEIHEMAVVDGVMRMRDLPNGLVIPAQGQVELRPGSYHVMFMDLTRPLREGERINGTVRFRRQGDVRVVYEIGPVGAGAHGAPRH